VVVIDVKTSFLDLSTNRTAISLGDAEKVIVINGEAVLTSEMAAAIDGSPLIATFFAVPALLLRITIWVPFFPCLSTADRVVAVLLVPPLSGLSHAGLAIVAMAISHAGLSVELREGLWFPALHAGLHDQPPARGAVPLVNECLSGIRIHSPPF